MYWLEEQRKFVARCLILDELPFPAATQQLVVAPVAGGENPIEEGFASVPSENKVRFLALIGRIAWDSERKLVFFSVVAAKTKKSGLQVLHGITARFQRGSSY